MEILKGIGVSAGIAIAEAFVFDREEAFVPTRFVAAEAVEAEQERFLRSVEQAKEEIEGLRKRLKDEFAGEGPGAIFDVHVAILADKVLVEDVCERIRDFKFSAEYAIDRTLRKYIKRLTALGDDMFIHRTADFEDIERRLVAILRGHRRQELSKFEKPVILVAHNLSPSQTVSLDRKNVQAFVTDMGGKASHTAILAADLGIPAVVGLGTVSTDLSPGDIVIVDGHAGLVIISPVDKTIERYRLLRDEALGRARELVLEVAGPAVTADGIEVSVMGNIDFPEDVEGILKAGGDGVGLYRTEFLFLRKGSAPSEADHMNAYRSALRNLHGKPLVIRTFDLGADKVLPLGRDVERNPFLGCRSIRLAQAMPELFRTQLRAILKVSTEGDVRCMLPLITTGDEVRWAMTFIEEVREDLRRAGLPFDEKMPVGIMVETPAAALMSDALAKEADFFSIGTNDLVQYSLAVDRGNRRVATLFDHSSPAVLKLIQMVIQAGERTSTPVSLCGEMAGDVKYTPLLLGMGLRWFSVPPGLVPELKRVIRSTDLSEAAELAGKALALNDSTDVSALLETGK